MIIKPMIRSNICINAHPVGCAKETERQIAYVQSRKANRGTKTAAEGGKAPKAVLVLGCSTGYGLASRITAAFEYGAATIGVSFEKEGSEKKGGTPGWYNNLAFDRASKKAGIPSVTLNMDAFSDDCRKAVVAEARKMGVAFDLVVYSLASPVRTDPETGVLYKSVLKPFGKPFSGQTVDMMSGELSVMSAEPANDDEAAQTVKVMGGEDWERWIDQLAEAGVLAKGCKTVAYSYIGPALSHAIYRDGTIGGAKKHLEKTARALDSKLSQKLGGEAFVSVNKGLVTRSSAVIPIIPLYLSVLFKVMKEKGTHEGCIEQMERLFAERLYTDGSVPVDAEHLIRMDDWELDPAVQAEVDKRLAQVTQDTLASLGDMDGYRHDFLATNGFDVAGVDYDADVERMDVV
ncbi:enoyl-ACP reductase FabV [Treponema brennaborense]|uniref:Trans-2-enoyl-CoA reductase [NADH] n=1 Tax=Treponema brennaborense (strain DSM 12168 / CIP 105900 / DD5/3) TaxID=906968 RepID=F4LKL1_TREBD|nr:enoyl-ACP reductase FabV [Treponema brennaborense]AEE17567.1 reductase [Treponema brennaborense DSM 12168]